MVVTSSLARGLVRGTIAQQSVRCSQVWARLYQSGLRAPASLRRFRAWFEEHERTFQGHAVLIVHGRIGRRRGIFTSFMPAFCEDKLGWVLKIDCLRVQFEPGRIVDIRCNRLPLTVCGHALERMFQRGDTLEWVDVRDALADALVFFSAAYRAYVDGGYLQGPLPVSNGLLIGEVADEVLALKTFMRDDTLRPRHTALLSDFQALLDRNAKAFHLAAACGDEDAARLVTACIGTARHGWLRDPHEPREDWVGEAWASRARPGVAGW